MIASTITLELDEENRDTALEALRIFVGPTRSSPGCVECCLWEEVQSHGHIQFITRWESEETLRCYLRSTTYRRILGIMDMASQPPSASFETITDTKGMEYLTSVLQGDR